MLYSDYLKYLAQTMPDISGIFTTSAAQPFIQPQPDGLEQVQEQIDMLEKYPLAYQPYMGGGGEGGYQNEDTTIGDGSTLGIDSFGDVMDFGKKNLGTIASTLAFGPVSTAIGKGVSSLFGSPTLSEFSKAKTFQEFFDNQRNQKAATVAAARQSAIAQEQANREAAREAGRAAAAARQSANREARRSGQYNDGGGNSSGGSGDGNSPDGGGGYCFDPNTLIQMADGSEKKIKDIKLGDDTKGGEVTGVFQFKAADEIHDYKGVTVAGSHYVKENGKFIMVKDSPLAVKIDRIPVVYSLDTSNRRIFIKDIEFADYNGDGIAKHFLNNAGVDLSGFDKEVLRQVENRLI